MEDKEKDVFISYSSKNITDVNRVLEVLDSNNISYWKAPDMIPIGSNYAKEIPKVISACKVFLIIISNESQESIWVEKEIDYAINKKKRILPLKISGGGLNELFSFYLNNVQMISYDEGIDKALEALIERLESIIDENIDGEEKSSSVTLKSQNKVRNTDRSFGLNPQPTECVYCKGPINKIVNGVYKCEVCGKESYDYFRTVRNYLEKAGPSSRYAIEQATGVPKRSIDYFFEQEMLEIPTASLVRARCKSCGTAIRTGILCENCKR